MKSFINKAKELNIPYIKHYEKLISDFTSANNAFDTMNNKYIELNKNTILNASHEKTKIREYAHIYNNDLDTNTSISWSHTGDEYGRSLLTKYCSSSHHLAIETGRWQKPKIPHEH